MLPPKPLSVRSAPIGVTLLRFTKQHAEADAGFTIAFVAKLMQSNELRFPCRPVRGLNCNSHETARQPEEYCEP